MGAPGSRAAQKAARRQALLDGAIAVLLADGLEGFTTGRIAKQAGIRQSSFYVYFADRDTCLEATTRYLGDRILQVVRETRQDMSGSPMALAQGFSGALRALHEEPALLELALRYRRSPGLPGDLLRELIERARRELAEDLLSSGLVQETGQADRWAFLVVHMTLGVAEGLVDGVFPDVESATETLVGLGLRVLQGGSL